jgi:hypothetical protein
MRVVGKEKKGWREGVNESNGKRAREQVRVRE